MWLTRAGKIVRDFVALWVIGYSAIGAVAWGFTADYEKGNVSFFGRVTDISCTVSVNGQQGPASVWLAPVSLSEIQNHLPGAYLKPQPFTLRLSHCRLDSNHDMADNAQLNNVQVRWVAGFITPQVNNENAGYLANTLADGARNIYLALAVNDADTLDKGNKIIPGEPNQNQVAIRKNAVNGGEFTYYVGYVTQAPHQVTTGPIVTRAIWELIYN